jgi:acyl dehydratase
VISVADSVDVSTTGSLTLNKATFVAPVFTGDGDTKALPVPARATVASSTGLPYWSARVTVTVVEPGMVTAAGLATTVELIVEASPATKVTLIVEDVGP